MSIFWILRSRNLELLILRNDKIWKSWKVEDEEWANINFPAIKSTKAWTWISFRSKNMKRLCAKTNQLFYFQIRESLSPINIPSPTPASGWGGPVAWLSDPVAWLSMICRNQIRPPLLSVGRGRRPWNHLRRHPWRDIAHWPCFLLGSGCCLPMTHTQDHLEFVGVTDD